MVERKSACPISVAQSGLFYFHRGHFRDWAAALPQISPSPAPNLLGRPLRYAMECRILGLCVAPEATRLATYGSPGRLASGVTWLKPARQRPAPAQLSTRAFFVLGLSFSKIPSRRAPSRKPYSRPGTLPEPISRCSICPSSTGSLTCRISALM